NGARVCLRYTTGGMSLPAPTVTARDTSLVRLCRARDLIRDCFAEPVTLADCADEAGLSPWHLLRSFRDIFGETPKEFHTRLRLPPHPRPPPPPRHRPACHRFLLRRRVPPPRVLLHPVQAPGGLPPHGVPPPGPSLGDRPGGGPVGVHPIVFRPPVRRVRPIAISEKTAPANGCYDASALVTPIHP